MRKVLSSIFSKRIENESVAKEELTLSEEFCYGVKLLALGQVDQHVRAQIQKEHQKLLYKYQDVYRKTDQYSFLSEEFNSCPDLSLRSFYRERITSKAVATENHS